jgi:Family of unknown function (DUF6931)
VAVGKLKFEAQTAQEICAKFPISDAGRSHLREAMPPLDFLQSLVANSAFVDAVQFLARALPKREAVWWSCLCAREVLASDDKSEFAMAVGAAEAWVYKPNEENRRNSGTAGDAIAASHPSRWSAMAAFWSGGSLAPGDAPEVKPPDDFTAKAVAGAVLMAAGLDPQQTSARQKRFVDYGMDIAKGGRGRPAADPISRT